MKLRKYNKENVNYNRLLTAQQAWFTIMLSVIGVVFIGVYMVLISSNGSLFMTESDRLAIMIWSAVGGMLLLTFMLFFINSWETIRKIQEEELIENTQLFVKKEVDKEEENGKV